MGGVTGDDGQPTDQYPPGLVITVVVVELTAPLPNASYNSRAAAVIFTAAVVVAVVVHYDGRLQSSTMVTTMTTTTNYH